MEGASIGFAITVQLHYRELRKSMITYPKNISKVEISTQYYKKKEVTFVAFWFSRAVNIPNTESLLSCVFTEQVNKYKLPSPTFQLLIS